MPDASRSVEKRTDWGWASLSRLNKDTPIPSSLASALRTRGGSW